VAVLAAGATVITALLHRQTPLGVDVSSVPSAHAVRQDRSSPTQGNPAADLTLIVFTDYRCPACRSAHPAMKRAIARDSKVRIVYKDWPIFGAISERAAQVAIASDLQNIYPMVHDRLMTGAAHDNEALRAAVEESGGDWDRLQEDLARNQSHILAMLARNGAQAFALGLGGTPGYLIGSILVRGALAEAEFTRAFSEAREKLR
jgi:protein-disulfide isomerase